jgi:hypothetical protein
MQVLTRSLKSIGQARGATTILEQDVLLAVIELTVPRSLPLLLLPTLAQKELRLLIWC